MAYIAITNLSKTFEGSDRSVPALQDINLSLLQGEFVCLLGPSGCGKSTLLNAIAGFIQPSTGEIIVDGRQVSEPGPERGVVFQEYAIFPWMTVSRNIAFGLEIKGASAVEIVDKLIDKVIGRFDAIDTELDEVMARTGGVFTSRGAGTRRSRSHRKSN